MFQKWAIPNKGLLIRFPNNMIILPESGAWVDWTGSLGKYWRKKEIQGDITVYDAPPIIKKVKEESATKYVNRRKEI